MFSKLPPRNLFFLALAVALAVVALWYVLRFQPRQQQITDLSAQADSLSTQVIQLRSNVAQLPKLREEVAALRVEREKFVAALPKTANFNTVVDEVRLNASAAGADMTALTVQPGNTAGLPAGVRPLNLNVSVSGTFAQMFQTLRSMETMGRFTTVSSVGLQLPEATSFDPDLQGALALTVYTFDPAQAAPQSSGENPAAPTAPPAGGNP